MWQCGPSLTGVRDGSRDHAASHQAAAPATLVDSWLANSAGQLSVCVAFIEILSLILHFYSLIYGPY